ncbi:MAG TPA: trigger factor [Ruminococcaceae bacterium]|nr:trigger factor [Oscillospiraceae bacterium]
MEIISNNKTEVNTSEVIFKSTAEEFEAALQVAYLKKRKNITVPGFRKGKATRKMVENHYGEQIFFDDAVSGLYREHIEEVIKEAGLDVVDMPSIEVTDVSKEEGVTYKAVVTTKPEVNISDYKGIKVTKIVKNVTDEDVDNELKTRQNRNARIIDVTDRAAEKGDTVIFDFEGFVDGVAFEGGKAEKFSLELGSGQFIPGFEDQVIGHNIDEGFDVNVTFPADYTAEELRSKEAVFKCYIHEIKGKELAPLDDEFAKDVSEFDTLDELKADIKTKLSEQAEKQADMQVDTDINNTLIEKLEGEIPDAMYQHRITEMVRDWEYRNRYQGVTVQDYLKYTGATMEQFRENFKEPAVKQVKLRLALEKIVQLENIESTDEELEKHYADLAEEHKMEVEKVKQIIPAESLAEDIKVEKAFDLVKNSAEIAS